MTKAKDEVWYPVAEIFQSVQGEGFWTGSLMTFVRLAGCNVGKPYSREERDAQPALLRPYIEKCHSWSGREFSCDTNYQMSERIECDALLNHGLVSPARRVLLTGGEPLLHDVIPLVEGLFLAGKKVHVETSGTKDVRPLRWLCDTCDAWLWICVSPKRGYLSSNLDAANEIKVLVDQSFSAAEFEAQFGEYLDKVWLQPINREQHWNQENVGRCLQIQEHYPETRLSLQMHKVLGVR